MFHSCSIALLAMLCVIMLAFKLRKVTLLTCFLHAECTMLCVSTEVEGSTCHTCGHAVTMLCASTEVEGSTCHTLGHAVTMLCASSTYHAVC